LLPQAVADVRVADLVAVEGVQAGGCGQAGEGGSKAIEARELAGNGEHGGIQQCGFEVDGAAVA
jgi:hypothetical protein